MKYLKKFQNHTQYETYINGDNVSLPNVSLCVQQDEVHYTPMPETRIITVINITDTAKTYTLANYIDRFDEVEIDGVVMNPISAYCTFQTAGEHTVKYTLKDPTKIGYNSFINNGKIVSLFIPDSVVTIEEGAFKDCSGITYIRFSENLRTIGEEAFIDCRLLNSINLPNSLESVDNDAFYGCTNVSSITIGENLTSIGSFAFGGCRMLTSITVDNRNTVYDSRDNCNALIETETNTLIKGSNNTIIPNTVTSIDNGAFGSLGIMTALTIPSSVEYINYSQFTGNTNIQSITCLGMTAPQIENHTFYNIKTGGTLYVPQGSTGYDVWMQNANYYLGKFGWTKVEQ